LESVVELLHPKCKGGPASRKRRDKIPAGEVERGERKPAAMKYRKRIR
jgi:hypothetical protein